MFGFGPVLGMAFQFVLHHTGPILHILSFIIPALHKMEMSPKLYKVQPLATVMSTSSIAHEIVHKQHCVQASSPGLGPTLLDVVPCCAPLVPGASLSSMSCQEPLSASHHETESRPSRALQQSCPITLPAMRPRPPEPTLSLTAPPLTLGLPLPYQASLIIWSKPSDWVACTGGR